MQNLVCNRHRWIFDDALLNSKWCLILFTANIYITNDIYDNYEKRGAVGQDEGREEGRRWRHWRSVGDGGGSWSDPVQEEAKAMLVSSAAQTIPWCAPTPRRPLWCVPLESDRYFVSPIKIILWKCWNSMSRFLINTCVIFEKTGKSIKVVLTYVN